MNAHNSDAGNGSQGRVGRHEVLGRACRRRLLSGTRARRDPLFVLERGYSYTGAAGLALGRHPRQLDPAAAFRLARRPPQAPGGTRRRASSSRVSAQDRPAWLRVTQWCGCCCCSRGLGCRCFIRGQDVMLAGTQGRSATAMSFFAAGGSVDSSWLPHSPLPPSWRWGSVLQRRSSRRRS